MKKILYFLTLLVLGFSLVSCKATHLEDIIPLESDYADWDGNYIYFDRYRCKTDGSDEEVLFNEIIYLDDVYEVIEVIDYLFYAQSSYIFQI